MAKKVELTVTDTLGRRWESWPVTVGMPFPQGELHTPDNARVLAPANREAPSQLRVLAVWPDGSVKWLLVDFQADVQSNRQAIYRLDYGRDVAHTKSPSPLRVSEDRNAIKVDTGALKFNVSKKRFTLFENVTLAGQAGRFIGSSQKQGSVVVDDEGASYRSSLGTGYTATVEEQGPCRVVIRCEGWHESQKKRKRLKCIVRIYAYVGKSFLRMFHTIIDAEHPKQKTLKQMEIKAPPRAHHFYHYMLSRKAWDYFAELAIDLPVTVGATPTCEIGGHLPGKKPVNAIQYVDDSYYVHTGSSTAEKDELAHGRQLRGWACVAGPARGVTVGVRHCWQNFPKGFQLEKNHVRVLLWPAAVPPLPIAKGVAKTHELFFYFHKGGSSVAGSDNVMQALQHGLLATARPNWYSNSRALNNLLPLDRQRFPKGERLLDDALNRLLHERRARRMYGMMEFGDHGASNAEVDLHCHGFLRYVRTGDRRYHDYAEAMSTHFMDVDVRHYHTNPRLQGGAILHPRGLQHFEYGVHVCHNYVEGLLLHYFLSGYQRALDVAKLMGDCMINIMEPSGLATHDGQPDGESCGRDNGRILIGLSELYLATGQQKYLAGATKAFQYLRKTQRPDGSWYAWTPADIDRKMGFRRTDDPAEANVFTDTGGLCGSIILRGLMKLHQATDDSHVRRCFLKGLQFMLNSSMNAGKTAFLQGTFGGNALRHAETGHSWHATRRLPSAEVSARMLANLAYAYQIANNREYMNIARHVYRWLLEQGPNRYEMYLPYYFYEANRMGHIDQGP